MPMVGMRIAAVMRLANSAGHALQDDGKGPRLLDSLGVGEQLLFVALHAESRPI